MGSILNEAYFHDEAAALETLEAILWPNGPTCPHCGATDRLNRLEGVRSKPSKKHPNGLVRHGLWKCYHCRGQFTVRKGTIFESSHLKVHQWFQAAYLLWSSKKGISSNQLARTLGVTVKTAWFASHRLREAMRDGGLDPLGGAGKIAEADETFLHDMGRFRGSKVYRGTGHKRKVRTLIERGGNARSFHIENLAVNTIAPIVRENIARESALITDEARHYTRVGAEFSSQWADFIFSLRKMEQIEGTLSQCCDNGLLASN